MPAVATFDAATGCDAVSVAASLLERKRKNGKSAYIVQFMLDKQRRSVFLDAKYRKRVAKETSLYVDELAKAVEFGLTLERRTLIGLENIDDDLRSRLQRAGLVVLRERLTIADLIERYFEAESGSLRPTTIKNKRGYLRCASKYLDFSLESNKLTSAAALSFKNRLAERFSEATYAGTLKVLARIYAWSKTLELIDKNPFEQVAKGMMTNKSREHFGSLDVYQKILEHCENQTVRTLLRFIASTD